KRIVFYATDRIRPPAIRLGKVSQKKADKIRLYVEDLIGSKMLSRQPEKETAAWLHKIDDRMHDRLVTAGLVEKRDNSQLEPRLDAYLTQRADLKPKSKAALEATKQKLVEHFGACRELRTITANEASEWEAAIKGKLSTASV